MSRWSSNRINQQSFHVIFSAVLLKIIQSFHSDHPSFYRGSIPILYSHISVGQASCSYQSELVYLMWTFPDQFIKSDVTLSGSYVKHSERYWIYYKSTVKVHVNDHREDSLSRRNKTITRLYCSFLFLHL